MYRVFMYYFSFLCLFVYGGAGFVSLLFYRETKKRTFLYMFQCFLLLAFIEMCIRGDEFYSPISMLIDTYLRRKALPRFFGYYSLLITLSFLVFTQVNPTFPGVAFIVLSGVLIWCISILFVTDDSTIVAYLYVLPFQCYNFWLALWGLHHVKKASEIPFGKTIRFSLKCLAASALLIWTYDTVSCFAMKRLNVRNWFESVSYLFFAALFLYKALTYTVRRPSSAVQSCDDQLSHSDPSAPPHSPPSVQEHDALYSDDPVAAFAAMLNLTKRESEVLPLLLSHLSNQQICDELHISVGTIKTHAHNIFQKASVASRSDLISLFQEKQAPHNFLQ